MSTWRECEDPDRFLRHPSTCPILAAFMEGLPSWVRNTIDLVTLLGTASHDVEADHRRAYKLVDFSARRMLPIYLSAAHLSRQRRFFQDLPEIDDEATAHAALASPQTIDRWEQVVQGRASSATINAMRESMSNLNDALVLVRERCISDPRQAWRVAARRAAQCCIAFPGMHRSTAETLRQIALDALDEARAIV